MDTLSLLWIGGAGAAGAVAGAAACHWHLSRRFAVLRERVDRAEQARNGAIERSAQAREQIAQLNKAIDELRRAHSTAGSRGHSQSQSRAPSQGHVDTAQERREAAERALAAAGDHGDSQHGALRAFADTEVLNGP